MDTMLERNTENLEFKTPIEKTDHLLSSVFKTEQMDLSVIDVKGDVVVPDTHEDNEVDVDHKHIRSNMYNLLQQGNDALQYALELAKTSESPRAFEVVGTLMKNLSDMNLQLLDTHDKKQKLKTKKEEASTPQKIVNNSVVFNGTTAEINKMLEQMKKEQ